MPRLNKLVQGVETASSAVSIGGRTLLSIDSNPVPSDWEHITKIDPEEGKKLPLSYPLFLQHTGAVSVGGSRDVTDRNTEETFELVNAAGVSAFHEPSAAEHVTDRTRKQADFMAIPEVLNGDSESLVGELGQGIEHVREEVAPELLKEKLPFSVNGTIGDRLADFAATWMINEAVFEGYIIQNVDSAAAREANVTEDDLLEPEAAKQHAMAAERHLDSEVIYLEYSGTFGGEEALDLLSAIDDGVTWSRVWYGGGLDNRENAEAVLEAGADAAIVGDVFHDIATEEAEFFEQARDALDADATRADVRQWLKDEIDVGETSAARYLSTIVKVPDPERRAARYLAQGIHIGLQLAAAADGLGGEVDERAIERALDRADTPGEVAFADALTDEDAGDLARRLGASLLAGREAVDLEDGFEARHLAVEL